MGRPIVHCPKLSQNHSALPAVYEVIRILQSHLEEPPRGLGNHWEAPDIGILEAVRKSEAASTRCIIFLPMVNDSHHQRSKNLQSKSWAAWTIAIRRLGGLIGPNPTDRGKAGSKRSLLVEGQGGPLSIVVAGANAHDATLLDETLEAIVVERPQLTEDDPQHLCLARGMTRPGRRRRQTRLSATHPTHRRGEVGRFWAQAVSCAPVGCGTDSSMALQVPCGSGTLRQKGVELHRIATACVRTPVVPSPMATCHFEIVSKPQVGDEVHTCR